MTEPNRAARRAARFTKAGRLEHAERTRHICEHGNWMKTDGNGNPMCPHGCGFNSSTDESPGVCDISAGGTEETP